MGIKNYSNDLISLLGPLSLIAIGLLVEKQYTGRISLFANAIALISFFGPLSITKSIPFGILLYINILTILGIIGIFSYSFKIRLVEVYYKIGTLFGAIITGIILLYGALTFL